MFNSNEIGKPTDPSLINSIERIHNGGETKSFKLLGVLFDEYLSFEPHIKQLCAKLSKSLYCINRIKNFVDCDSLKKLYFAMIHSSIVYCINVYGCANKTTLAPLIIKQKQAIRTISKSNYRDHTAPRFVQLGILPVLQLIQHSQAKFMHSFHFNKLPISFAETWVTNRSRNPALELRNSDDLFIPPHRIELVKRMPLYTFPLSWNSASEEKFNPIQHQYLKSVKNMLLASLFHH